jgi:hypothetical protein
VPYHYNRLLKKDHEIMQEKKKIALKKAVKLEQILTSQSDRNDNEKLDNLSFFDKLSTGAGKILFSVRRKNPKKTELRETIYNHFNQPSEVPSSADTFTLKSDSE